MMSDEQLVGHQIRQMMTDESQTGHFADEFLEIRFRLLNQLLNSLVINNREANLSVDL